MVVAELFTLDEGAKARADKVLTYAYNNPYKDGDPNPSNNPNFIAEFGSYRAIFTLTKNDGMLYKHLCVSVKNSDMLPPPPVVFIIADLFGFTGFDDKVFDPPRDWVVRPNFEAQCVVVAQKYGSVQ